MENFSKWLIEELEARRWKQADLVRASGLSDGTVSHLIRGTRKPGPEACVAIADAFGLPPEFVFRQAGLLPKGRAPDDDPTLQELVTLMKRMTAEERQEILEYALFRYRRRRE